MVRNLEFTPSILLNLLKKELISLHIGQAGVQMGNAIWELLCAEHGIMQDGEATDRLLDDTSNETFFKKSMINKYVPRSLFVDLEPTVIDEIRNGSYRTLFHPEKLISGPEDAANNFARGFFTVGKLILFQVDGQIRKLFEGCDFVQAIIIYRSLGGGTGAGLTSAMFEGLSEYPKTLKVELPIYPSARVTSSTVEPYNCLLGEHFCMEDIGLGLMIDNESLYEITYKFLHRMSPSFCAINRLISHVISNLTASIRFQSICSSDVTVLQNNLVPYPRIHYPMCNMSPLAAHDSSAFDSLEVKEMTQMLFLKENQLIKIDPSIGKYMSCVLFYRGNINICDVYDTLFEIKRNKDIHFVDWCPTGFKVGINLTPPTFIPEGYLASTDKNVLMLTNTSSIGQAWQRLTHRFYLLYSKRSFVHWFVGEGMEECEFTESLYNISSLVKDYEEIVQPTDLSQFTSSKRTTENLETTTAPTNPHENVSLYVTMAGGVPVSAPDRTSLTVKSSMMKPGFQKQSMNNEITDLTSDTRSANLDAVQEETQITVNEEQEDANEEVAQDAEMLSKPLSTIKVVKSRESNTIEGVKKLSLIKTIDQIIENQESRETVDKLPPIENEEMGLGEVGNVDGNVCENLDDSVENNVADNVDENVSRNVDDNVDSNVYENIYETTDENIDENADVNIAEDIYDDINDNIDRNVDGNADVNFGEVVRESVNKKIDENVNENVDEIADINFGEVVHESTDKNVDENVVENVDEIADMNFDQVDQENVDDTVHENREEKIDEYVNENIDEHIDDNVYVNLDEMVIENIDNGIDENNDEHIDGNVYVNFDEMVKESINLGVDENVEENVDMKVDENVDEIVDEHVYVNVEEAVHGNVDGNIDNFYDNFDENIKDGFNDNIDEAITESVVDKIIESVGENITETVDGNVGDNVEENFRVLADENVDDDEQIEKTIRVDSYENVAENIDGNTDGSNCEHFDVSVGESVLESIHVNPDESFGHVDDNDDENVDENLSNIRNSRQYLFNGFNRFRRY